MGDESRQRDHACAERHHSSTHPSTIRLANERTGSDLNEGHTIMEVEEIVEALAT
jgi:hypothetical protein